MKQQEEQAAALVRTQRPLSVVTNFQSACVCIIACLAASACDPGEQSEKRKVAPTQPLVVYSSLPDEIVRSVTDAYTAVSGTRVNYMLDDEATLIGKLERKEHRPGADILLIPGTGYLAYAVESDVLRPTNSQDLRQNVPENMRDPDHYWFGLSAHAVTIVYDERVVDPANLVNYSGLSDEMWVGQLCLLTSSRTSSRTLVAFLIAELGEKDAEIVVRRWMNNLAEPVFSTARDLLLAVEEGLCQVAFVASDDVVKSQIEGTAQHVAIYWPSMDSGGSQLNLLGGGVTRHAGSPARAVEFLEWLATEEGQRSLHQSSHGFPVNEALKSSAALDTWVESDASLAEPARLGYLHEEASLLVERARYR